ncbi:right-handed parallel beta-helix repeat-containing protein [Paenibacillus sp. URB8-2]|uniref:right-handed parallel beta-helix repeat-containing protein n=1 Tax=Paenibacillus sp. URB8-2 TaxID=2741301 RepID=UPI0015BFF472|nr:right-handed parallel beta-helix repeat-containing protein [Paenibacillus sp. URB8-2]BCG57415.1 hypothetical protein PUR_08400 [Paenibacillus sp. URB8-2]
MSKPLLRLILPLIVLLLLSGVPPQIYGQDSPEPQQPVTIELSKWKIYNDGTHPSETTKGINAALAMLHNNGVKVVTLPSGTYLIDKDSRINMVSDMTFILPDDAVLQKEANGKERYETMFLGYGVDNVTLKGGTYSGDKDRHDFSKKDSPHSPGTHENGYGILMEGASDVVVDGVKTVNFTGDGMAIGGVGTLIKDLYEGGFVPGALDAKGYAVNNKNKIRTQSPIPLTAPVLQTEKIFEISNVKKLPYTFEVYFYQSGGKFIKKISAKARDQMAIPPGAAYCHLVLNQASSKGGYLEVWNRVVSRNITVRNSESAFNRRQGITVGGADNVLITGNRLHDIKGTAPQSGIDVEGGYGENGNLNTNITIKNNQFYNNAAYDAILYDGRNAWVDGNHFASKGTIGLAISPPFSNAWVSDNHFDGTRIYAYHDVYLQNNAMNDSATFFEGPNIVIDGMKITNGILALSAKKAYGIKVSNIDITITQKVDAGLSVNNQPVRLSNVTITGEPSLRSLSGNAVSGSVFDHLKVIGYNSAYGLSLPPGTYKDSRFDASEGGKFGTLSAVQAGEYVFDGCTFRGNTDGAGMLYAENKQLKLTVKNSAFEVPGNMQAISIQAAQSVLVENNVVNAEHLTSNSTEIVKINDYWKRNEPYDVGSAVIRKNKITSNLQAVGISTEYAGIQAPPYTIEGNTLINAQLSLKANDRVNNNILQQLKY